MKVGGLQKFSLIDYPEKISAIVFTQGCNFRCPYCHNPELVDPARYGPVIPKDEVLSFLESRRGKLDGVAVTGGEPTIQSDLVPFLESLKEMRYLIKVDTNGSHPSVLENLIEKGLVDYLAIDIKGPLERYGQIASVEVNTSRIEESIHIISASGIAHEFRTTVVRTLLSLEDLASVGRLLDKCSPYVLQTFVPGETLGSDLQMYTPYSKNELATMQHLLRRDYPLIVVR